MSRPSNASAPAVGSSSRTSSAAGGRLARSRIPRRGRASRRGARRGRGHRRRARRGRRAAGRGRAAANVFSSPRASSRTSVTAAPPPRCCRSRSAAAASGGTRPRGRRRRARARGSSVLLLPRCAPRHAQRGWNAQPPGMANGAGGEPGIDGSRLAERAVERAGSEASRPHVYGCRGASNTSPPARAPRRVRRTSPRPGRRPPRRRRGRG